MTSTVVFDPAVAVEAIRTYTDARPELVLILGSGLGALADEVENPTVISTEDIPGYPRSTVPGHAGRLVFGEMEGRRVLFVQGRIHMYEGHASETLGIPVRLAHMLGAQRLLVTNAAGGINPDWDPGTLMLISDHINYAAASPLAGHVRDGEVRFPDMTFAYDPQWRKMARTLAAGLSIDLKEGVYLWTRGPSYETPAEIRFFRLVGADAVGMSTVPEVIQAAALGMPVLGISAITNLAAGLSDEKLDHEDVLAVGQQVRDRFAVLIRAIIAEGWV